MTFKYSTSAKVLLLSFTSASCSTVPTISNPLDVAKDALGVVRDSVIEAVIPDQASPELIATSPEAVLAQCEERNEFVTKYDKAIFITAGAACSAVALIASASSLGAAIFTGAVGSCAIVVDLSLEEKITDCNSVVYPKATITSDRPTVISDTPSLD